MEKFTLLQAKELAHLNETQLYYDENIGVAAWEHELDRFKGDPKGKRIQII